MANISVSMTQNYSDGTPGQTITITGAVQQLLRFQLAASTTNQQESLVIARANCVWFFLVADSAVTLKTNSSGSPADTKTLSAGVPIFYCTNCGLSSLSAIFSGADITTSYWTNSSSSSVANVYLNCVTSS